MATHRDQSRGKAGILSRLEREHTEIASLMDDVLSAQHTGPAAREHYPAIRKRLLVHLRAEERVFYPACERDPDTAELVGDARSDHDEMESLLDELDRIAPDAPAWLERFESLREVVESHVEDEEEAIFERCRDAFDTTELRELDDEYAEMAELLRDEIPDLPLAPPEPRPSV